jgi:hypothetical protein
MTEEQELWERAFFAALTATATNSEQWPSERTEFIANRALHIADRAVPLVLKRRRVSEREDSK